MTATMITPRPRKQRNTDDPAPPASDAAPLPPPGADKPAAKRFPGVIMEVPLSEIDPDSRKHRHPTPANKTKIKQLAESFQAVGQLQPIGLFPHPSQREGMPKYVLSWGSRRADAADLLAWPEIRAIVFDAATPEIIQQARAIENLQQEGLGVLEQMDAVLAVVASCGGDVDKAAGLIGKEARWIKDHLFLERLSPKVRAKVENGTINLAHARQIAKLSDHRAQEEIIQGQRGMSDGVPDDWWKQHILRSMQSLDTVSWKLDQPFADKPPCTTCPHNSINAAELFELHPKDIKGAGTCGHKPCFDAKAGAVAKLVQVMVKKAEKDNVKMTKEVAEASVPEFIRPEAVVSAAADHRQQDLAGKPRNKSPLQKARQNFSDAKYKWSEKCDSMVRKAIVSDWRHFTVAILLDQSAIGNKFNKHNNRTGELTGDAARVFEKLLKFDDAAIKLLAEDCIKDPYAMAHRLIDDLAKPLRQRFVEAMDLQLPPIPDLKDFLPAAKPEKPARRGKEHAYKD